MRPTQLVRAAAVRIAVLLDRATKPRVKEGHKNEILLAYDELVARSAGSRGADNEGVIAGEEDVGANKVSKQSDNQVRHALTLLKSMSIALTASVARTN